MRGEGGQIRKCRLPGKKSVTLPSSSLGKGYLGADPLTENVSLKVGIQHFPGELLTPTALSALPCTWPFGEEEIKRLILESPQDLHTSKVFSVWESTGIAARGHAQGQIILTQVDLLSPQALPRITWTPAPYSNSLDLVLLPGFF